MKISKNLIKQAGKYVENAVCDLWLFVILKVKGDTKKGEKAAKQIVASLYPIFDGVLEDKAMETPSPWDNWIVNGFKRGCIIAAKNHLNIDLVDLDND